MKKRNFSLVPAILLNGAAARIDISTLPQKDWEVHSGHAPVANEEVHSLQSQMITGTKNVVLKAESGAKLCVTQGEAEIFALDYLTGRGYEVTAPKAARA